MKIGGPDTAPFGDKPPLPQLTLRVGIVGHRPKPQKLPIASVKFVQGRLGEVFTCIDTALAAIVGQQRHYFADSPAVRLVSGLAEGADQMAIEAMPERWTLDAVLPFPSRGYEDDFGQLGEDKKAAVEAYRALLQRPKTTVTQLPGERSSGGRAANDTNPQGDQNEDAAYVRLGGFLLRQIDILVAVWDGRPEDGKGGTAEVVRAAVGAAIPTVWIHSLDDTFARIIESIEADGKVWPSAADCCKGHLREKIEAIVGVPGVDGTAVDVGDGNDVPDRLRALAGETWPSRLRWVPYDFFRRFIERKRMRLHIAAESADGYRARLAPAPEDDPAAGLLRERLDQVLLPRYAWADALAVAYSHRYRSAYFVCYLLAALAVAVALLGVFTHDWPHDDALDAKVVLVTVELLIIFAVIQIVRMGRQARWKEKWLEYRSLAELLFNISFLSHLAEHGRTQKIGALDAASAGWLLWYLRATIREIGLPHSVLDGSYQRSVLAALEAHVVARQRKWHLGNAGSLRQMHEFLSRAREHCFEFTFGLLVLFLLVVALTGASKYLGAQMVYAASYIRPFLANHALDLTFFAAFFPALGAAFAGIRETGDFEKVAHRSQKTAAALGGCAAEIEKARKNLTLDRTGDALLMVAVILTEDLDAWQSVYGEKRLELPA